MYLLLFISLIFSKVLRVTLSFFTGYNYALECDNDTDADNSTVTSDSDEESDDNDFIEDRQTDEDYSAYSRRIFDFSPRG